MNDPTAIASGLEAERATQVAFHLTDWLQDFRDLHTLYANIERIDQAQLQTSVIQFLAHVPEHLAAAKKLVGLGPIEDIFGVGALNEDE